MLPDPDGRLPGDRLIGCRAGESFPASSLERLRPLSDEPEIEAQVRSFLGTGEGQSGWIQDGWWILRQTDDVALVVAYELRGLRTDAASLATMRITRTGGEWRWNGSSSGGDCPLLTQPPGQLGVVEWELDPLNPPGFDDTTISVLVSGLMCSSGRPVVPRLVGPDIVMTDRFVMVAFAERPPDGDEQTCEGGAPEPLVVELPEPLQGRPLVDGLSVLGRFGADHLAVLAEGG